MRDYVKQRSACTIEAVIKYDEIIDLKVVVVAEGLDEEEHAARLHEGQTALSHGLDLYKGDLDFVQKELIALTAKAQEIHFKNAPHEAMDYKVWPILAQGAAVYTVIGLVVYALIVF